MYYCFFLKRLGTNQKRTIWHTEIRIERHTRNSKTIKSSTKTSGGYSLLRGKRYKQVTIHRCPPQALAGDPIHTVFRQRRGTAVGPEEWLGMAERQQDPCSLSVFFPSTEGREQTFAESY